MCSLNTRSIDALWDIYNQSESVAKYQAAALLHINKEGDFMEYTVPENINALARQFNNEQHDILQNKVQNDSDFTIFPNPASDEVILTGNIPSGARLVISDMNGKIWKNMPISNTFKITDIPNGIYIYHIISDNKVIHSAKLVVAK